MHPKAQLLLEVLDDMWLTDNWIDPMWPLLQDWPAELTQAPYKPGMFSVQDIVNHTAFWEEFARRNLTGEPLNLYGNSDAAWGKAPEWMPEWPETASHYQSVRNGLRDAVTNIDPDLFSQKPDTDAISREMRVVTRAIHAGYHAGQLSFLHRLHGLDEAKVEVENASPAHPQPCPGGVQLMLDMMDSAWSSGFSINPFEEFAAGLTTEQADLRVHRDLPSTTEIVNHMTFWEDYVCRRLQGTSTDDMAKVAPGMAPEGMPGWPQAGEQLIEQHRRLRQALSDLSDEELARPRPGAGKMFETGHTALWLAQGAIVHHAYHIGQLVLIRQLAGDPV